MTPRNELEEWLTELPPLDGDEDESAESDGVDDFVPEEGQDSSLDDASADDLDVDEGVEITEEEPVSKDDDGWQADVGEPELDFAEGEASAMDGDTPAESPSDGEGELDIDDDLPATDDDAGEEGTTDPIEHSLDQDLPALDADDEGDFEDELLLEVKIPAGTRASVRWADAIWEERAGLSRRLVWPVDDEDSIVGLVLGSSADVVAAVTERDALLVSLGDTDHDPSGRVVQTPAGERGPWLLAFSGTGHPVLWAANRAGEIARSGDLGSSWTRCAGLGRPILAIGARDDGTLSVLARRLDTVELLTSVDGTRWFAQRLSLELRANEAGPLWIAHRGTSAAIGDAGGVSISRDGRRFTRVAASSGATAGVFAGRAEDAPLVVAGPFESDDAIHLLRIASEGDAEIIGELKAPAADDDDPKVLALAWHDATETLRVAFATHVVTWCPKKKGLL